MCEGDFGSGAQRGGICGQLEDGAHTGGGGGSLIGQEMSV